MGLVSDIRKKIEKKYQFLAELEAQASRVDIQMREVNAAIQAYEEILKIAPDDSSDQEKAEPKIRPGSMVDLAREALRKHGSPMHVGKLLEAMGKRITPDQKISLGSSLSAYVRDKQIFSRPEPNI